MSNNVDDLEMMEPGMQFDVSEFEGKRVKIDIVEIIDTFSNYNEEGEWVEGLKRPVKKLKVASEILKSVTKDDGTDVDIRASMLFNLKEKKSKDGKVSWGVSKHQKSKLFQFMKKLKVGTPSEIKGQLVTVTARPSSRPDDDREFLGFAV